MKDCAIVTGAAGFTGAVLVEQLRKQNTEVYAVVRPGSSHNNRLDCADNGLHIIELDIGEILKLSDIIKKEDSVFYNLAIAGGVGVAEQSRNVDYVLEALKAASIIGCRRFVGIGSQAEYGVVPPDELIVENRMPRPITAYGAAKVAACFLSKQLAEEKKIEWVWGRIFSVIGKYESAGRMFPELYKSLRAGEVKCLSSCCQNWDYLDVYDAADAIIALGQMGKPGEIYNIANGSYRPLKDYTEELRQMVNPSVEIFYGDDPNPFISLQPSVKKIKNHTGWCAKRGLEDSLKGYLLC